MVAGDLEPETAVEGVCAWEGGLEVGELPLIVRDGQHRGEQLRAKALGGAALSGHRSGWRRVRTTGVSRYSSEGPRPEGPFGSYVSSDQGGLFGCASL